MGKGMKNETQTGLRVGFGLEQPEQSPTYFPYSNQSICTPEHYCSHFEPSLCRRRPRAAVEDSSSSCEV